MNTNPYNPKPFAKLEDINLDKYETLISEPTNSIPCTQGKKSFVKKLSTRHLMGDLPKILSIMGTENSTSCKKSVSLQHQKSFYY